MPSFLLGSKDFKALDGNTYTEQIQIKRETAKAILLSIERRGKSEEHWIPKSLCKILPDKVAVADWFWEKEGLK